MSDLSKDKYLSENEIFLLNKKLSHHSKDRDIILLRALFETGARASEILMLTKDDFRDDISALFIRGLKGSRSRWVPISNGLYNKVKMLSKNGDGRPFPISYPRLDQIWREQRPKGCKKKLHSLRHTRALLLYEQTKDIKVVQQVLGHKSLANTMIYMSWGISPEELAKKMRVSA